MGVPGAAYIAGVSESWIAIGLTIGAWLNWKLVAARLRLYTEVSHNALTLPDYFRQRFEDKSHWLAVSAAAVILVFFTIYCASGMVAGARLFENTFHLPYSTALWLGAIATIAYVFIGGFLAVSWTDTIQASLMCIALIVTPVAVMIDLGGASAATSQVAAINPGYAEHDERSDHNRHHFASRLGSWLLRPAAHPRPLHGDALNPRDSECPPHFDHLDDLLPRRVGGCRVLRRRVLRGSPGTRRCCDGEPRTGLY